MKRNSLSRREFIKRLGAGGLAASAVAVAAYKSRKSHFVRRTHYLAKKKLESIGGHIQALEDDLSLLEHELRYVNLNLTPVLDEKPNIVLISADTLRADYFRNSMPETCKWAQSSCVLFEWAYSASTWTLPSHVSMLSGFLPHEHGAELSDAKVPSTLPMIQERLRRDFGYETHGLTNKGFVSKQLGFDRGFDTWFEIWEPRKHAYEQVLLEPFQKSKQAISSAKKSRKPFFAFVHTYFPHEYLLGDFNGLGFTKEENDELAQLRKSLTKHYGDLCRKGSDECNVVAELYRKNVKKFDLHLRSYIDWLTDNVDNLAIIFTSDHGESLGEERVFGHKNRPFFAQIHVPLLLYGFKENVIKKPFSNIHIPQIIESLVQKQRFHLSENEVVVVETVLEHLPIKMRGVAKIKVNNHYEMKSHGFETYAQNHPCRFCEETEKLEEEEPKEQLEEELKALGYL